MKKMSQLLKMSINSSSFLVVALIGLSNGIRLILFLSYLLFFLVFIFYYILAFFRIFIKTSV